MGKLHSKHASRRRESPEGGSLASNVLSCQRELERMGLKLRADLSGGELRGKFQPDHDHHLKVALPPERGSASKPTKKRNSHSGDMECNVVLEDDAGHQWLFTHYDFDNSGKVTKEDMSSLMHSIYEVIEASVKRPCSSTTVLRVKLVVAPSRSPEKISQTGERRTYCVDENTERRNHYLDLAGIENYASKFDDAETPSQEPRQEACPDLHRHPVVVRENCIPTESRRGLSILRSLRSKAVEEGRKAARSHGQHPALWCPQAHVPLHRTHSKRLRSRVQDAAGSPSRAAGSQAQPGGERERLPSLHVSPPGHRHDHHHHHEHHHHHHHHHYHPS